MSDEGKKDKSAHLRERLQSLQDLVLPHALPHVRAEVQKKLAEMHLVGGRLDGFMDQLRQELLSRGESPEDVEAAVADARQVMEKVGSGDHAAVEELVGMALLEAAARVVASWTDALVLFASRRDGLSWVRASMLGVTMLPVGDKECTEAFVAAFREDSPIDANTACAILRDVHASLPAGKALPEDMVAVLDLAYGIIVVP